MTATPDETPLLKFHGGTVGALLPFLVFLSGVAWLGLSGAPDERGFWPVLIAALALGMVLARDRHAYSETLIAGMSQPVIMLMIMAWLLAGILGKLMQASGLVESLVWLARGAHLEGSAFVVATFLICAAVSTSTGTSFGTLFLCTPLLYPAGAAVGADPSILIGAILGGATFGDNISPISDSTIASATTQKADLGGVVISRMRYALPAAAMAIVAYVALGGSSLAVGEAPELSGNANGLPMLLAPALVLVLLLRRRHLIEGLLFGILASAALGVGFGLLEPSAMVYIDAENFGAKGLIIDGINHGVGVVVFTLLLMGLVAAIEATGLVGRLIEAAGRHSNSQRGAEVSIFAATSAAVLLTTHSVVAILAVGELARRTGERFGINPYRRSNLLDVTVCTYPFLLPFCIPTILASGLTSAGPERVSPLTAGLYNFHSWALLAMIIFAIATGYGRSSSPRYLGFADSPQATLGRPPGSGENHRPKERQT